MSGARLLLVVTVAALAVGGAATAAGAPTPPVIHEPFTPLPCPLHPDTTVDIEGCQEHRILRTDRAIDNDVKAILGLLRTTDARASFVAGEQDWLRYRRRSCAAEATVYAGGSGAPVAYLSCTVRRNRTHLADLGAMKKTLGTH